MAKRKSTATNNSDGKLYLGDPKNPPPPPDTDFDLKQAPDGTESFTEILYFLDVNIDKNVAGDRTLYEQVLANWKDPTSPPHTRKKCIKYCRIGPITTCCEWKLQYKWIYNTAIVRVTTSVPHDIEKALNNCLRVAAVAAAVAAIITKGQGAIAAAEAAIKTCLYQKFGKELLNVAIRITSKRGDWE